MPVCVYVCIRTCVCVYVDGDVSVWVVCVLCVLCVLCGDIVVCEFSSDGNGSQEVTLRLPRRSETYRLIAKASEYLFAKPLPVAVEDTVRWICSKFLWLDALRLLIGLLGISLKHDELPGSALPDEPRLSAASEGASSSEESPRRHRPTEERRPPRKTPRVMGQRRVSLARRRVQMAGTQAHRGILAELEEHVAERTRREEEVLYEGNCARLEQVFDQLSNHTGESSPPR